MMIKSVVAVAVVAFLSSCGGGSGGDGPVAVTVPTASDDSVVDICTAQSGFFDDFSGSLEGVLTESLPGSSFCEFEVSMELDNNPNPQMNCLLTGTVSYTGTQLIAAAGGLTSCANRTDLPISVRAAIPFIVVQNREDITLPTTVALLVDGDLSNVDADGNMIRHPFFRSQNVTLDSSFSIIVDNLGVLGREIFKDDE